MDLFERSGDAVKVHPSMPLIQDIVGRKMVRPNALVLSAAAQFNDVTAVEIIGWLNDTAVISCSEDELNWKDALRHFDDAAMRERIVAFSQYADLGIEDIEKSGAMQPLKRLIFPADTAPRPSSATWIICS